VRAYRSLDGLGPLVERLDALNLASRRPSPFATIPYLRAFLANDEFADGSEEPLLLVAFAQGEPVGWLPLRRHRARALWIPSTRIEFLVTHDNDRPGLSCRAADEARCAEAFLRHLVDREPSWSWLEWMEQDGSSPLARVAHGASGFFVRRFANNPNATVECRWANAGEYYRSLSRNFRASLRKGVNRLFSEGRVEFASSSDPEATARLLDLHLELEQRSWKGPSKAGIGRHPRRIAFFRSLLDAAQPMRMSFRILLIDGVPIASELNGLFEETWYSMEVAYDESYRDCNPGHLLFLMTIRDALERRSRAVNLLNNYAYVKRRYNAVITETAAVQIFRPGTPPWAKAHLGDLRRRLLGRGTTQADVAYNLEKPRPARCDVDEIHFRRPDRSASARCADEVLQACAGRLERADGQALLEIMRPPEPSVRRRAAASPPRPPALPRAGD
jgi:CelD/BcsL family acetyltransferase involved in cellulose biosynthesis